MRIIKMKHVFGISILCLNGQAFAMENHSMHMQSAPMNMPNMEQHEPPSAHLSTVNHADQDHDVDHTKDHGGQIYQSTELSNKWLVDESGKGIWLGQLESWIGTDENKLFIQLNVEKEESEKSSYDNKFMYSRAMADFWDIQAGIRYTYDASHEDEKSQTYAAFGLNGLAPYFFDTDVYAFIGKDKQVLLSIESDRDVLLTQKLIMKPYFDAQFVLNDESKYAKKSGLSELHFGLETRYEITKNIKPYIDVSYGYEKGDKQTNWQDESDSEKSWLYGVGVQFNF